MWIILAFGSALFAGLTAVLAKCGASKTDSDAATAVRTSVVLVFSWLMTAVSGSVKGIFSVGGISWLFLVLSGLATAASWLCYFRALKTGDVTRVAPVDKSSTVLTMVLAFIILGEDFGIQEAVCCAAILAGTLLMTLRPSAAGNTPSANPKQHRLPLWLIFAVLSAVFASLTAILAKVGIENVPSDLATAIRTTVVFFAAWGIVFARKKTVCLKKQERRETVFLLLSGLATGGSWLCYYAALSAGPASIVVPIDKLSLLVTVFFSAVFLKEKLRLRDLAGLALITAGTLLLLL